MNIFIKAASKEQIVKIIGKYTELDHDIDSIIVDAVHEDTEDDTVEGAEIRTDKGLFGLSVHQLHLLYGISEKDVIKCLKNY